MVVGRAENPDSCSAPDSFFCFLNLHAESERCFWSGLWTAETCTVLLENVLGQVDVAAFQAKDMSIQNAHHHAHMLVLRVTTPTLSGCLSRLP